MSDWTFNEVEGLINHLGGENINLDKHGFSREFKFEVFGAEYVIVWFKNQSTLICGDLRVMFARAELSNTWPSPAGSKMKAQFYGSQGNCVAVIPISYHRDGGSNDE